MSDIKLSIGGVPVTFKKSESLVAVKRNHGALAETSQVAALTVVSPPHAGGSLGGFELRKVASGAARPDQVLEALRKSNAIADGAEVFHTSDDQVPFVPTGQIYVEFHDAATTQQIHQVLDDTRLAIEEARGARTFILTTTPTSPSALDAAAALQKEVTVKVAEPDLATFGRLKAGFLLPTDPLLREQWHLNNTGFHRNTDVGFTKGADARVIEAWAHLGMFGSPNVTVAIIDDGFDLAHPDLGGTQKIVAPRDFTRNSADPSPSPQTADWHGTACAGVAIGSMNGLLVVGAAPACRLMPVRWGPDLSDAQVERWFDWVHEQGATVVSCSWGAAAKFFPLSTRTRAAIARCARQGRNGKGIVICFAAGNDNHDINGRDTLDGFAIHPDVIAVAACTSRDQRSSYSNFGKEIWVSAPSSGAGGWGITTSDVSGTIMVGGQSVDLGYATGPVTHEFGGTSSACPLVAGVCALILSANPELTAVQVKDILRRTARKIGEPKLYKDGHSEELGYGCVNAVEAVRAAQALRPATAAGDAHRQERG